MRLRRAVVSYECIAGFRTASNSSSNDQICPTRPAIKAAVGRFFPLLPGICVCQQKFYSRLGQKRGRSGSFLSRPGEEKAGPKRSRPTPFPGLSHSLFSSPDFFSAILHRRSTCFTSVSMPLMSKYDVPSLKTRSYHWESIFTARSSPGPTR